MEGGGQRREEVELGDKKNEVHVTAAFCRLENAVGDHHVSKPLARIKAEEERQSRTEQSFPLRACSATTVPFSSPIQMTVRLLFRNRRTELAFGKLCSI